MANKQITQLPNKSSVEATDKFAIQEVGGTTKNVTALMISDYVESNLPTPGASDLESVLAEGNTSGANDIVMARGQAITSPDTEFGIQFGAGSPFNSDKVLLIGDLDTIPPVSGATNSIFIAPTFDGDATMRMVNTNFDNEVQASISMQASGSISAPVDIKVQPLDESSESRLMVSLTQQQQGLFKDNLNAGRNIQLSTDDNTAVINDNVSVNDLSDPNISDTVSFNATAASFNPYIKLQAKNEDIGTSEYFDAGLEIDPLYNNNGTRLYSDYTTGGDIAGGSITVGCELDYTAYNGTDYKSIRSKQGVTLIESKVLSFLPMISGITSTEMFKSSFGSIIDTTNATETNINTLTPDTSSGNNKIYQYKVTVFGTDATGANIYTSELTASFKAISIGSTVSQIGTTDLIEKSEFTTATTDITTDGTDINVTVTGEDATNISWRCYIELVEK